MGASDQGDQLLQRQDNIRVLRVRVEKLNGNLPPSAPKMAAGAGRCLTCQLPVPILEFPPQPTSEGVV